MHAAATNARSTGNAIAIVGGRPLAGTVRVSGSKNASLPLLAASLLADGPTRLRGLPDVLDVAGMLDALADCGVAIGREGDALTLDPSTVAGEVEVVSPGSSRGAICLLGPLLARGVSVSLPRPGGCAIGPRPIDVHLRALRVFGAEITFEGDRILARAGRLRGAEIDLRGPHGPSVTATANALMAATAAEGESRLSHAAREPEVVALARAFQSMGAEVAGAGTDTVTVRGGRPLRGVAVDIPPDRIEAGTWLCAALAAGGDVRIENVPIAELNAVLAICRDAGASVERVASDAVRIVTSGHPRAVSVTAAPHPGFPTDLQAPLTAALLRADGTSAIDDAVFPERFGHLDAFRRFGGRVVDAGGEVRVSGPARLRGAEVDAGDLRGAAALVIAALTAEGRSVVTGKSHLDRGYEDFLGKLAALGGAVTTSVTERLAAAS